MNAKTKTSKCGLTNKWSLALISFFAVVALAYANMNGVITVTLSCGKTISYISDPQTTLSEVMDDILYLDEYYCGDKS